MHSGVCRANDPAIESEIGQAIGSANTLGACPAKTPKDDQEPDPTDPKAGKDRKDRTDEVMGDLIETPGERPVIAVTLGDPAGIGPEVVLKALADPTIAPLAAWTIVGDRTNSSVRARRAAFRCRRCAA